MEAAKEYLLLEAALLTRWTFHLDMWFDVGDMQFLNNHVIFHSRRGFLDFDDQDRKRHLMRIWLKAMDGRPLPDDFYARHGRVEEVDRPGGIVGPDTKLSAPLTRQ